MRYTLPKAEKLVSLKAIDLTFADGKSLFCYPIKLLYTLNSTSLTNQSLFSVPKRNFKRANKRNTIKRRMREAYRLNKHIHATVSRETRKVYNLVFIYIAKEEEGYSRIEESVVTLLNRLAQMDSTSVK